MEKFQIILKECSELFNSGVIRLLLLFLKKFISSSKLKMKIKHIKTNVT